MQAASGEAVRPDATDRRHIVLVTPARVTLLRPCPAPGSLAAGELAAAASIAPAGAPRNVAVIAYNEVYAVRGDIAAAIPFFDLLTGLGYLGHAVWIFEGHVSAMAAGCQDADVLIVNGFPAAPGQPLLAGDRLVLIRRGAMPDVAELDALLSARHTPGVHARVKQATTGIAGVGGLGSAVAIALAGPAWAG